MFCVCGGVCVCVVGKGPNTPIWASYRWNKYTNLPSIYCIWLSVECITYISVEHSIFTLCEKHLIVQHFICIQYNGCEPPTPVHCSFSSKTLQYWHSWTSHWRAGVFPLHLQFNHRYRKEIPELLYRPVQWHRQPWSSNCSIWVFAGHTSGNKGKQMRPWSSLTLQHFMRVYFHAQTAMHMHLANHGYLNSWENANTPNWNPTPVYRWHRSWDLRSNYFGLYYTIVGSGVRCPPCYFTPMLFIKAPFTLKISDPILLQFWALILVLWEVIYILYQL